MQHLFLSFFIVFALSAHNPSNGLQVSQQMDDVLEYYFQGLQIVARAEGEGKNDQLESRGITIWLGPHWIAPGGGGRHLKSFGQNLVRRDSAMLLVGKRR